MKAIWTIPSVLIIMITFFCYKGLYINQKVLNSTMIGQRLADDYLPTLSKTKVSIGKIKGPFVLNVFASWCPACKYEHGFWALQTKYKVIGLAYKDDTSELTNWLELYGNPYKQVILDQSGEYALKMGVYGTPETFLISASGVVLYRHVGPINQSIWNTKFLPILRKGI